MRDPTGLEAHVCPKCGYRAFADRCEICTDETRMCEATPCPDCYGGHFRPCQLCGDSGVALLIVGSAEPPQCGNRDSTDGNEDAKTVEPAQSPTPIGTGGCAMDTSNTQPAVPASTGSAAYAAWRKLNPILRGSLDWDSFQMGWEASMLSIWDRLPSPEYARDPMEPREVQKLLAYVQANLPPNSVGAEGPKGGQP